MSTTLSQCQSADVYQVEVDDPCKPHCPASGHCSVLWLIAPFIAPTFTSAQPTLGFSLEPLPLPVYTPLLCNLIQSLESRLNEDGFPSCPCTPLEVHLCVSEWWIHSPSWRPERHLQLNRPETKLLIFPAKPAPPHPPHFSNCNSSLPTARITNLGIILDSSPHI